MRKIALMGKERIEWTKLRNRTNQKVMVAIKKGLLPNLKKQMIICSDCKITRATQYDHRDYNKPLDVEPVCRGCNIRRGTNAPTIPQDKNIIFCPECKSQTTLYRRKTNSLYCRRCGFEWNRKKGSSKNKQKNG